jgi:hypothetical protein
MGNETITSNGILTADKGVIMIANFSTFSGWIAEGQATDRCVGVGISSHQIQKEGDARATTSATISKLRAASSRMTHEQLKDKGRNLEESVDKWPSDHSAPIFIDQSIQWRVPMMTIFSMLGLSFRQLRIPIPVDWISSDAVNDWIKTIIHASLRNLNPQMSSKTLSTPQNPGFEKSKKLLLELWWAEKAQCWKMNNAKRPRVKMRNKGM